MDHLRETCNLIELVAIKLDLTTGIFQIYYKTVWMVIRFFETAIKSSCSIPAVKIIEKKKKTVTKFIFVVKFYLKCSNSSNLELTYVYFIKDFDHRWIAATGRKRAILKKVRHLL